MESNVVAALVSAPFLYCNLSAEVYQRAAATISLLVQQELLAASSTTPVSLNPSLFLFECAKGHAVMTVPNQPDYVLEMVQCSVVSALPFFLLFFFGLGAKRQKKLTCLFFLTVHFCQASVGNDIFAQVRDLCVNLGPSPVLYSASWAGWFLLVRNGFPRTGLILGLVVFDDGRTPMALLHLRQVFYFSPSLYRSL